MNDKDLGIIYRSHHTNKLSKTKILSKKHKDLLQKDAAIAYKFITLIEYITPYAQQYSPYIFVVSIGLESFLGHINANRRVVTTLFMPILGMLVKQNRLSYKQCAITMGAFYLPYIANKMLCMLYVEDKIYTPYAIGAASLIFMIYQYLWSNNRLLNDAKISHSIEDIYQNFIYSNVYLKSKSYIRVFVSSYLSIYNTIQLYFQKNPNSKIKQIGHFIVNQSNGLIYSASISVSKNIANNHPKDSVLAIITVPLIEESLFLKNIKNIYLNDHTDKKKQQETKRVLYKVAGKMIVRSFGIAFYIINKSIEKPIPKAAVLCATVLSGWVINIGLKYAERCFKAANDKVADIKGRMIAKSIKNLFFSFVIPDVAILATVRPFYSMNDGNRDRIALTCYISFLYHVCFETRKIFLTGNKKVETNKDNKEIKVDNKHVIQYGIGMTIVASILYCASHILKGSDTAKTYVLSLFGASNNDVTKNLDPTIFSKFVCTSAAFSIVWGLAIASHKGIEFIIRKYSNVLSSMTEPNVEKILTKR